MQINSMIEARISQGIEEISAAKGYDVGEQYDEAVLNELSVDTNGPCNYCSRDDSEECEDSGKLVVFTKVKVNVEDYLNEDLRERMDELLENSKSMMDGLRNK